MIGKDEALLLPAFELDRSAAPFSRVTHLISQYAWLLLFLIFLLIPRFLPNTLPSGSISSAPLTIPWNSRDDPIVFGHLTDVHINSFKSEKGAKLERALVAYTNLSISNLVLTGDLVDNWGDLSLGRYGHQYEPDYKAYETIWRRHRSSFRFVGDIAGNHDEFGLYGFTSRQHFILNYSLLFQKSRPTITESFWASSHDAGEFQFIAINPYRFPTPHAKFDFWSRENRALLDAIEQAIGETQHRLASLPAGARRPPIVFGCHYPVAFWIHPSVRSSSGRTFRELISGCNASIFLSGHTHPASTQYVHHNGLLEAVGIDLTEHDGYSIVTVDSGRTIHHSFKLPDTPRVLLTHPVPARLLSSTAPFVEASTEIRLIARQSDLSISVTGAVRGKMAMTRRLANGWYLYSHPLSNLGRGLHRLNFTGDWESAVEFFAGKSSRAFPKRFTTDRTTSALRGSGSG
jgi:predicted MPP superfamily phosphohydrolase